MAECEEVITVEDVDADTPTDDRLKFHCIATWKIKNFSCCQLECGEELFSPLFSADSSAKVKWYLSVFPNGQANFEEYVSVHVIFIRSSETNLRNFMASCKVSIIDVESNARLCDRIDHNIERFQFNTFVKRKQLFGEKNQLIPNDTLTILCQISAFDERIFELERELMGETSMPSRNELLKTLANDFRELFESGKFSDISVRASDGDVSAHRVILMARSPVFRTLLGDSECRSVASPSYDKNTIKALMSYIYSGQIEAAFSTSSLDLHEAAEKYKIQELGDTIAPNKIFAETEITNETYTYTWRLRNFSSLGTESQTIRYSERFHTGPSCRSWSLSIIFQKIPEDDSDMLFGIYLNKFWSTGEKKAVYINFSICLLDKEQQPRHGIEAEKLYKQSGRYGFSNFIKRSVLLSQRNDLLSNDTLTIRCNMRVCDGANSSKVEHSFSSSRAEYVCDLDNLSHCFRELLTNEMNCNVTVCAVGKEFRLHKPILCARSAVFAEFFERFDNGQTNYTINIQGIKAEILDLLFLFLYTGQLDDGLSISTAPGLYLAAEHYKIPSLKTTCADYMKSNACEIMALVNTTSDTKLKDFVKDFICSNAEHVFTNDQWPEFVRNHPLQSSEILKSLSSGYREAKRRRVE